MPITVWIECRLTICQLKGNFTRNNALKSIKSVFGDDSHDDALAPPAAELLTPSSSNFHHCALNPFSGLLTPSWDAVSEGEDVDIIFDGKRLAVDLMVLLFILDGFEALVEVDDGCILSLTAGERKRLPWIFSDADEVLCIKGSSSVVGGDILIRIIFIVHYGAPVNNKNDNIYDEAAKSFRNVQHLRLSMYYRRYALLFKLHFRTFRAT